MQDYIVEVIQKIFLTSDVIELTVRFVRPRSINFRAGQFVFFKVGGAFKAYSIVSSPLEKHQLKFCIKLEPKGVGSNFVKNLKLGERFEISGPGGEFVMRSRRANIICIANGVGVAPFVSMLPHLFALKKYLGQVILLWSAKTETDLYYSKLFNQLARKYQNFSFVSFSGKVSAQRQDSRNKIALHIFERYQKFKKAIFYICGSKKFIAEMEKKLRVLGHEGDNIKTEIFL